MPRRIPISLPYSIGTDIVHIRRIHQLISGNVQHNNCGKRLTRFLDRILHPLERQDFDRRFPAASDLFSNDRPPDSNLGPAAQSHNSTGTWLAGRWAAKEAAKKAWGAQKLGFKDIRVEICKGGEVQVLCCGWTAPGIDQPREKAEQVGKLSISHDGEYAVAMVIATPLQITPADLQDTISQ